MSPVAEAIREDRLLGGRVRLLQPLAGYRAATDPVLLAAAVPARGGDRVLDLGCGAGAAMLCLAARVEGLALTGLEREAAYRALAVRNAGLNGVEAEIHLGCVSAPPAALRAQSFDHVIANPPYHGAGDGASPVDLRDRAHREDVPLTTWLAAALARLRPKGRLTLIHRAERLCDILLGLAGRAGDIAIKPLAAREGRDAKRVIVTARKGTRGPVRLTAPLVVHAGAAHLADADDFTPIASAVLRDAAPLPV
ncbi:MAG: methyltransferase [Pseudomonadota bacterium]